MVVFNFGVIEIEVFEYLIEYLLVIVFGIFKYVYIWKVLFKIFVDDVFIGVRFVR